MCIYTKYILNPKYLPSKRNDYNPPPLLDERLKYVPTKCGRCIECRKQKQREWLIRMSEELKDNRNALFITLTINDKALKNLKEHKEENENDIATKAVRRFLERIRWHTKKSIRHWFVTELGEEKGRIHLHGIVWCNRKIIEDNWGYGYVYIGDYVGEKTITYITKYMLKENEHNKKFIPKVLCSKGIGSGFFKRRRKSIEHKKEYYRARNGAKIALPEYYRRNLFTDEEKEEIWLKNQEKGYRYIMGEKVSTESEEEYNNIITYYQRRSKDLYKDDTIEWDKQKHLNRLRKMRLARKKLRNKQT